MKQVGLEPCGEQPPGDARQLVRAPAVGRLDGSTELRALCPQILSGVASLARPPSDLPCLALTLASLSSSSPRDTTSSCHCDDPRASLSPLRVCGWSRSVLASVRLSSLLIASLLNRSTHEMTDLVPGQGALAAFCWRCVFASNTGDLTNGDRCRTSYSNIEVE